MAETKARHIANLVEDDGDVKSAHLDNITVTPTAVSDQSNTSTGYLDVPAGTTNQRPGGSENSSVTPNAGNTRFNTTTGSLEFYDGNNWLTTNLIPTINSITGDIYHTLSKTLTLSVTNATDTIEVKYYEGGTLLATDNGSGSGITVTNGSATSTVPSAVYGQSAGDTITIEVINDDGTPSSNSITKTVLALPSGGTNADGTSRAVVTSGGYRYHAFLASATNGFVIDANSPSLTVEYLIVAGGGGGGRGAGAGGGGGAGGLLNGSTTISSTTSIVVGGGGAAGASGTIGTDGDDSSFGSVTANGGGGGGGTGTGASGGSGGGGGSNNNSVEYDGGDGTPGQGNDGGIGRHVPGQYEAGGGGGGASASGGDYQTGTGGAGGSGSSSYSAWATATSTGDSGYYAGGGGGGGNTAGSSSYGGGGAGASSQTGVSGIANTGAAGGGGYYSTIGGAGGSGIVILRYQLS